MTSCRRDRLDPTISSTRKIPAFTGHRLSVGSAVTAGSHSSPLIGQYIYGTGSLFGPLIPFGTLGVHSPLSDGRARHSLRRARRQHRASQTGLTGLQLPLLRRATPSDPIAHKGGAHLCLCGLTGFILHCSSETLLRRAQRQHYAPQTRPDSGAYWLMAADPPSGRF
ncbi:hypothetical protein NDU88_004588 [Pleurodeles waltl]|uniref:Uncharacterized protein n=1 Tax=Pleurodeles waltl TaxID=8319 RepID=A0AAV7LKF9_PLEWA|nr:hypothetical protein NDU88_004588 [Pleurodeles waltl]